MKEGREREREGSVWTLRFHEKDFKNVLKLVRDVDDQIKFGRLFHQEEAEKENERERDLVSFCEGSTRRRSLAERRVLKGCR
ncbi:MAG: hypothetical protein ACRDDA_09845 [Aeromonas sp.]